MAARIPPEPGTDPRARAAAALVRSTGKLSTSAMSHMEHDLSWFGDLSAEERSWVGQIVQAGIRGFVDWYRDERHDADDPTRSFEVAGSVFGAAPRALAGTISLQQTVDLVRLSIEVVERGVDSIVHPDDLEGVRAAVLLYAREIAFATAEVYASAAELRGAWDARLEALVVDSVVRAETDETMLSRASALGWGARGDVAVVLGALPDRRTDSDLFDAVRRLARAAGMDALCGTQGERLVVLLGAVTDARAAGQVIAGLFGAGAVVVGPITDDLGAAHLSARAALAAHRAAAGWPQAPRPTLSSELLAERALSGDGHARRHLVDEVYLPLVAARSALADTVATYFDSGSSIEGAARAMFVHANTVRYRLRQVADLTGLTPNQPRDALTLQIALILGRQSGRVPEGPREL